MKVVADFLSSPLAERIGLTILHSIWQLTLVAMVGYLLLGCLRRFSPNIRYVVSYVVLLTMVGLPLATFFFVDARESDGTKVVKFEDQVSSKEGGVPLDLTLLLKVAEPGAAPAVTITSPRIDLPRIESESLTASTSLPAEPSVIQKRRSMPLPPHHSCCEWSDGLHLGRRELPPCGSLASCLSRFEISVAGKRLAASARSALNPLIVEVDR